MINLCISACLQNIGEGCDVAFDISVGVFQAVANAGLSSEMNYPVEMPVGKAVLDGCRISQIDAMKAIVASALQGHLLEKLEAGFLDFRRVVIVHDVDPDDRISALQQTHNGMKANKSSIARDQNSHLAVYRRWLDLRLNHAQSFSARAFELAERLGDRHSLPLKPTRTVRLSQDRLEIGFERAESRFATGSSLQAGIVARDVLAR